uniref:Uncharacterized protein n=1 Tax=Wuchereria bancrofti TaxID=6293 RepID=A0AAF5PL45_WUCBA
MDLAADERVAVQRISRRDSFLKMEESSTEHSK